MSNECTAPLPPPVSILRLFTSQFNFKRIQKPEPKPSSWFIHRVPIEGLQMLGTVLGAMDTTGNIKDNSACAQGAHILLRGHIYYKQIIKKHFVRQWQVPWYRTEQAGRCDCSGPGRSPRKGPPEGDREQGHPVARQAHSQGEGQCLAATPLAPPKWQSPHFLYAQMAPPFSQWLGNGTELGFPPPLPHAVSRASCNCTT